MKQLNIIAAISKNYCIGNNNSLPWHFTEDLRHFKRTTSWHAVIMGRVTYESIGSALPKRTNLVISRQPDYSAMGCTVRSNLDSALEIAYQQDSSPFIIGGSCLYNLAMPLATTIYLTKVGMIVKGDTFFPSLDKEEWCLEYSVTGKTPELTFEKYNRKSRLITEKSEQTFELITHE